MSLLYLLRVIGLIRSLMKNKLPYVRHHFCQEKLGTSAKGSHMLNGTEQLSLRLSAWMFYPFLRIRELFSGSYLLSFIFKLKKFWCTYVLKRSDQRSEVRLILIKYTTIWRKYNSYKIMENTIENYGKQATQNAIF